ncbi:MAG: M23 family metallopeptidase [Clostridia bacterium]|nr:M23 family metallopeptidase [Clostridia bacterium]
MSVVSNLIFHNEEHYVTSKFGKRSVIQTANGKTSSFHNGTDYGTHKKKLPQYAIEDGEILKTAKASDGALYVWVKYPRLGVKMLHYHLDSIKVKAGQKVDKNTILGYTGMTGKATGVHLHLGLKKLSGGDYIDPEEWAKKEYTAPTKSFLPARGYFKKGDKGENVAKINDFYYEVFPAYAKALNRKAKNVLGEYFGENTVAWTKEFQKRTGLEADGCIGKLTLTELKKYGFKTE